MAESSNPGHAMGAHLGAQYQTSALTKPATSFSLTFPHMPSVTSTDTTSSICSLMSKPSAHPHPQNTLGRFGSSSTVGGGMTGAVAGLLAPGGGVARPPGGGSGESNAFSLSAGASGSGLVPSGTQSSLHTSLGFRLTHPLGPSSTGLSQHGLWSHSAAHTANTAIMDSLSQPPLPSTAISIPGLPAHFSQ